MTKRRLDDWLTSFEEYLAHRQVPPLFAKWAGIATMAGFMQRRYWFLADDRPIYPVFFVLLVGEPAIGKGITIEPCVEILRNLPNINLAPDSMTVAAMGDELTHEDALIRHQLGSLTVKCTPLFVASRELQILMPAYDHNMTGRFNTLWDGHGYSERTRKGGERKESPHAQVTLLAGTTPDFISRLVPEGGWEGGFMTRCILAYQNEAPPRLFRQKAPKGNSTLYKGLVHDAKAIMEDMGPIPFADDMEERVNDWILAGCPPVQDHPRMAYYKGRRPFTVLRASLVHAISRGSKVIEQEDFERSLALLVETEEMMIECFKVMNHGGDRQIIQDTYDYVLRDWINTQKPIRRSKIIRFLTDRVPAIKAETILSAMINGELLIEKHDNKIGYTYKPGEFTD